MSIFPTFHRGGKSPRQGARSRSRSAEDQSERTLIKRKVIAQLGHGVYNV